MQEITTFNLEKTIITLATNKRFHALRDILDGMNPHDIAALFERVPRRNLPVLFRLLSKELAAETFVEMDTDTQELLISSFSDSELKEVIDELFIDDAVDIVEEMPANVVKRILRSADADTRKQINEFLKYPDDSAGSIMTTEFVELRPNMTAGDAVTQIRRTGVDKETINVCYVTQPDRKLLGYTTIRRILLASEDAEVQDIMEVNFHSVTTQDDQEAVALLFSKYDLLTLPVVDGEERLVGIVTVDDAIDVLQEETEEDIAKMAAVTPSEKPYLKNTIWELYKHRIVWLLVLMVSAAFTGMIIDHFTAALTAQAALMMFIPMLMDTGGNSGSQSSVIIIRGLALGELTSKDWLRIAWREMRVSVLCGVTLAALNFAKVIFFDQKGVMVAAVVSLTLIADVFISKLIGCLLPLGAKRIGIDPAVMASPLITTIVDALALIIYFGIASAMLST